MLTAEASFTSPNIKNNGKEADFYIQGGNLLW